jgi:hypothetical protein
LLENLRQYWTAEAGCFATPGRAFMTEHLGRVNGVMLGDVWGGDDERLEADEMLASDELQADDAVVEESVDEAVDEAERFRWQL